jgi:glycosyltransferase involved in cell wall biosynthesis
MILGVPSVASGVGAIMEMISHGQDGFIYPFGEPYLMAEYICQIFEDPDLARRFSKYGIGHASRTYDREENGRKLLQMYQTILDNSAGSPEVMGNRMQY